MTILRLSAAAARVGVHPATLRAWADAGKVVSIRAGVDRRFRTEDLDALMGVVEAPPEPVVRREALYVRVSGASSQETSLEAQEKELRETARGEVVAVFTDLGSGLSENRRGLNQMLVAATLKEFTVVRVTHEDRLARFGVRWLRALLATTGVSVEVVHAKGSAGGTDEILADFMILVTKFTGRLYGIRSREAKQRLLDKAHALMLAPQDSGEE